jgi:hypothetical protein
VDQVAWCLDAEGCTSIREGLGCLFRGGRRLGERVLYPRWSSHQDTAGCRFHREAHTTAGLIGIKVWINRKLDENGEVVGSGAVRRERGPRKDGDRRGPGGNNRGGNNRPGGGFRGPGGPRRDAPAAPAEAAPAPTA